MVQYIDKATVKAIIGRMQNCTMDEDGNFYSSSALAEYNILCDLENRLDTLEVKEVKEPTASDAFIEKACEWLKENFLFDEAGYCKTNIYSTKSMIYNFKNTLGGKL